jgi:hypothetical protein
LVLRPQGAQHNPAFIVVRSQQLLALAVSAQQLAQAMLKLPVSTVQQEWHMQWIVVR